MFDSLSNRKKPFSRINWRTNVSASSEENIFTTCTCELADIGATIVYLCGELDASSAPGFLADMQGIMNRGQSLIIDAHLLSYIDSTGASAILSTKSALASEGRTLSIVGSHGLLAKILHITRMDEEIKCYQDVDSAVADMNTQT